jgi:hypothetical protein
MLTILSRLRNSVIEYKTSNLLVPALGVRASEPG